MSIAGNRRQPNPPMAPLPPVLPYPRRHGSAPSVDASIFEIASRLPSIWPRHDGLTPPCFLLPGASSQTGASQRSAGSLYHR